MADCEWCRNGFPIWSANPYIHLLGGEDSAVCKRGPIERELRAFQPGRWPELSTNAKLLCVSAGRELMRRGPRGWFDWQDEMSEAIEAAAALGL